MIFFIFANLLVYVLGIQNLCNEFKELLLFNEYQEYDYEYIDYDDKDHDNEDHYDEDHDDEDHYDEDHDDEDQTN